MTFHPTMALLLFPAMILLLELGRRLRRSGGTTINDMIDITSRRQNAFNMHPPAAVYWLLFGFSGGSALMAGYSMTPVGRDWVYSVALALAVTLTVYTILDVEYPRVGLIHLRDRDRALISLRDSMK